MISSFFAPKKGAGAATEKEKEKVAPTSSSSSPSRKRAAPAAPTAATTSSPKRKKSAPSSPEKPVDAKSDLQDTSPWQQAFEEMEPGWKAAMGPYLKRGKEERLVAFLEREQAAGKAVYPPPADVFSFMRSTPLEGLRVVIVGQDPYHGTGQAHGLCFSVRPGVQVPPSLRNMLKEAAQDADLSPRMKGSPAGHGCLTSWSNQGVLLLNTCLTVRKAEPLSHKGQGWEAFTDEVVRLCAKREGLVYLCWGKEAEKKCAGVSRSKNHVLVSSHPSPLGAYKTAAPFIGSQCFSKCNSYLVQRGGEPIDWNL